MIRTDYASGNVTIIPHSDYRGAYHAGSIPTGAAYNCGPSDPCLYVVFPKKYWGGYWDGGDPAAGDWAGSLIRGQQDLSGLMYRRNRYYDPQTGQFTQSDPIGVAGGLNTYGFAGGDPVSYSDPFGLAPLDEYYYDNFGRQTGVIQAEGEDRHFMKVGSKTIEIDGRPIAGNTPYRFVNDPDMLDQVAREVAEAENTVYVSPFAFGRQSRNHNADLDFKPDIYERLGGNRRVLWNAGASFGGMYVHSDKVGNTAWGYWTDHHTPFTEAFAVRKATQAAKQTNPGGVGEALDARFIRRGFRIR